MEDERRTETDSLGEVSVPADKYWGAQTERSLQHFAIGDERWPREALAALGMVKKAAAKTNAALGLLDDDLAGFIEVASDEVIAGKLDMHFPLRIWQTGSGTQTNMNANEVIAGRSNELAGHGRGGKAPVHPNDHVNRGQSSNDVIPTVIHVAALVATRQKLLVELRALRSTLHRKSEDFKGIVKIGRTHLQDATPVTLGQEFSGYVTQLRQAEGHIEQALTEVRRLALGSTAVGTGLNTHPQFGARCCQILSELTGEDFLPADNGFAALSAHDSLVQLHGSLRTLSVALSKLANDIRWASSGPRCGIGELSLAANEPGSSIMPGKVNPTQCEALLMVCAQVQGNDVTMSIAGASGNFQLNVSKPQIAHCLLQSIRLLSDAMRSFRIHCAESIEPRRDRIRAHLNDSLMLVTALAPHIGYDLSARIAEYAHHKGTSLREAALALEAVSEADFDNWVRPEEMVHP